MSENDPSEGLTTEEQLDAYRQATDALILLQRMTTKLDPVAGISIIIGHYEDALAQIARGYADPVSLATIALKMGTVAMPGRTVIDVINGTDPAEILARES